MENLGIVVLVPGPFQGHITPMLELGTALYSRGFSIVVAHTIFNSPNPSNQPNFTFLPIQDNLSGPDTSTGKLLPLIKAINTNCEAPLRKSLAEIVTEQLEPRDGKKRKNIACIIHDVLMYFAETVAHHLNIPSMTLRTSAASATVAYGALPRLAAEGYFPLQDSMLQDLVPGYPPVRFKDLSLAKFSTVEDLLELAEIIENPETSTAIIWNTPENLEHTSLAQFNQRNKLPIFPLGPLHKLATAPSTSLIEEDGHCIQWLNKQAPKSVIYVSLGSLASVNKNEFVEMAWGIANSNQPFLWVVRPGLVTDSDWSELMPQGFFEAVGERGRVLRWAPQKEVLAHSAVGGFWSHCGWNSTLESISEGVPMICWPSFGDQNVNARYLSDVWRVGIELDHELERGVIERAIRRLMVDKEGQELRQRAIDMREQIKLSMKEGGSSYKALNELVNFILSF